MKSLKQLKIHILILPLTTLSLYLGIPERAQAQLGIAGVIKAGVKKVVKAVDLKVQRLQNKTIWLQNAQKTLENQLSKLKLEEIARWSQKQRDLYEGYYRELWEVKSAITYVKRVRELVENQTILMQEYKRAWGLLSRHRQFSPEELRHIQGVYAGILERSMRHVDELLLVVHAFSAQMSDASRLNIINRAAEHIGENLQDLRRFNRRNIGISLQRASSEAEIIQLKKLYGIAD